MTTRRPASAAPDAPAAGDARLTVGHKADTLERLSQLLTGALVDPFLCIDHEAWSAERAAMLGRVASAFSAGPLIVRSCFSREDERAGSRAGAYLSRGELDAADQAGIAAAVDAVFASYPSLAGERVMVQRQVMAVRAAGVAMLRTMMHDAPYYVVEYDATSGRTDTVTAGRAQAARTIAVFRSDAEQCGDVVFRQILPVLREIESLAGCARLEVEFALDRHEQVHVFQVRHMPPAPDGVSEMAMGRVLSEARAVFEAGETAGPTILGRRPVFGIMPDWNPAEIIGTTPRRLAFDLYRALITDGIWARQRAEFGYRDLGASPLLLDLAGRPYVDVRASLTSFVPATLCDALAARLVDHGLDLLAARPELHDKMEFEVAITCLTPDFPYHAQRLAAAGFPAAEIRQIEDALRPLTAGAWERVDSAMRAQDGLWTAGQDATSLRGLLEACRIHGTLPFAHLARCGFVATAILRGLVRQQVISPALLDSFLSSLNTVARQLVRDAERVAAGTLAWNGFVAAYGHLRPDTYEITASRYDRDPEKFLRPLVRLPSNRPLQAEAQFRWPAEAARAIEASLHATGLPGGMAAFDRFARRAIEGRERGKFLFSRLLSDGLEEIGRWGDGAGVSRECLSHAGLEDILAAMDGTLPAAELRARCDEQARRHVLSQALELPPLLLSRDDFHAFAIPASQPSFIGHDEVVADCVVVSGDHPPARETVSGRIVLVERADPGWDWLFGCGIAGLVTAFGGANSHIVVRAAELALPSAIGIGAYRLRELARARRLRIAPGARLVEALA